MRSFGRVKGRPLKPTQARLLADLAPRIAVDPTAAIHPAELFGGERPVALEIGFGGGEHLVAQALLRPDWGFIGVDPFLNGFSSCLRHVDAGGAANVRLHQGDARDVVAALPSGALERVWILFPDPWPKLRHHKRRLIQPDFISELSRILRPGGDVRFATDWRNYADWTLRAFLAAPDFEWAAETAADWRRPFAEHVETRYEAKRLGDCAPIFLRFVRT
jgi:tRNA (guanine-N7-)-methyltransferase